jgi:hypothetical protein
MGATKEKEQVKRFQLQALKGPGGGKETCGERSRDAQYSPAGPMTPDSLPAAPEDAAGAHLRREQRHRPAWSLQE